MFNQQELEKYAKVLLWGLKKARIKQYKPGEVILIKTDNQALPLANILVKQILEMRLNPVLRITWPPEIEKTFFSYANEEQIKFKTPGDKELYSNLNGLISLLAPESLTHLENIDPAKIGLFTLSKKYLREILEERENNQEFGWTLCLYPTQELANKANLDIASYKQQIIEAVYLNSENPVQKWEDIYQKNKKIQDWLNSLDIEYLHIKSKHTDLYVYPGEKRKWIGISGHNIPSFEIFLSPDLRFTHGIYFANQPSYRNGNLVKDVWLKFEKGKVIEAKAKQGEEFVRKQIALDKGASYVGEFSLTDKRFSKISKFMANTLYDENFGGEFGNCHIALGASYADTYAGNPKELTPELKQELGFNDSGLHWDLVNTEDKIVEGKLKNGKTITIYKKGEFNIKL
ncbi:Leucyl aminopeptidase (aminopeptidase T) [Desulfonauticus submarinus]|uniref:Leucyl aminopeptidase (Aminopeptidase T) n=1 Tax=Desulfonauticus submarinus TaxID=206665 RepID=A0A1H0DNB4_9BACT|nr:aminopeptidase [Desulfonauticus submarinus]SDN71526.1 Leucyl aminopeptidase (aminopeptidase T) [Desulfonauticus submarinus]